MIKAECRSASGVSLAGLVHMLNWGLLRLLALTSLAIVVACSGKTVDTIDDDPPTPIAAGSAPRPTGPAGAGGASPLAGAGGVSSAGRPSAAAGSGGSTPVMFTELQIQPKTTVLLVGGKLTITVWGLDANGLKVDVTQRATVSASDPKVATLQGRVLSALAPGKTTVNAQLGELSASAVYTVEDAELASLEIIAFQPSCSPAQSIRFDARGKLKDGSTRVLTDQVQWSVSQPAMMASWASGLALCLSGGALDVQATFGQLSAKLPFQVTGAHTTQYLLGPSGYMRPGWSDVLQLTANYDDGSTVDYTSWATFESDQPNIAHLSSNFAYAGDNGKAQLTAKLSETTVASATWNVSDAPAKTLQLTPAKLEIAYPAQAHVVATATFGDGSSANVTRFMQWADNQLVNVSVGEVTAFAVGTGTITGSLDDVQASAQVTVTAGKPDQLMIDGDFTLPPGVSYRVWATGIYDNIGSLDLSQGVTWQSSDPSVAAFPDPKQPWIVGKKAGTVTITATLGALTSDPHTVTISEAQLSFIRFGNWITQLPLDQSSEISIIGTYDDFNEYDVTLNTTWQIANPAILRVEKNATGSTVVVPLSKGKTTITATVDGASVTGTIAVVAGG